MSIESLIAIGVSLISLIAAPFIYIWKSVMQRIEILERNQSKKMDADQVKELLLDKLQPLKEDIKGIENKLDKIIEHLIDK